MNNTQDDLDLQSQQEGSLVHYTNHSFSFQVFSIALASFYRKTNLSGQMSFAYSPHEDGVLINLSFSPRVPNEEEYLIFLDDLKIAERFVVGNSVLSYTEEITDMDELNQFKDKITKETKAASIFLDISLKVE